MEETRAPTLPARIEPLATLPIFYKLAGKKVVLAVEAGSEGALWKAELLLAAGAEVHIYARGNDAAFAPLTQAAQQHFTIIAREWRVEDFSGAALALGDFEAEAEAACFAAAARAAGVPVNVIDKPAYCDFQFGSLVNRSPLIVAISTDGAAPIFGQAIRAKIEALLPKGLKAWAEAAKLWRVDVQKRALPYAARRKFWEQFTARALKEEAKPPQESDKAALLALVDTDSSGAKNSAAQSIIHASSAIMAVDQQTQNLATPSHVACGRVTLVGAGPGDAELLTLKAVRVLQGADVILYDQLVTPEVLERARREALRIYVGKTGHGPACQQKDIHRLMIDYARAGKNVVRLKSGDPLIFGRAGEELDVCRAEGIEVSIIPGISAAQGAAASLGVSLTHRDHAQRLQYITGHSREGVLPDDLSIPALGDKAASTIIYMPKHTIFALREKAFLAGLSPHTPAIAVISATRADEERIFSTLQSLPEQLSQHESKGPVLILLGNAFGNTVQIHAPKDGQSHV